MNLARLAAASSVVLFAVACGDEAPAATELAACPIASATPAATPGAPACVSPLLDPASVRDACGVFVAPNGSDETGNGTEAAPFATIGKALTTASTTSLRVFACEGTYAESLLVPAGVSLHGGFACSAGWIRGKTRTVLAPAAGKVGFKAIEAGEIAIDDVDVTATAAAAPGSSAIAAIVQNTKISLTRATLAAGAGSRGIDGAPGAPGPTPLDPSVLNGEPGRTSCMGGDNGNMPGEGAVNPIEPSSKGGRGGTGFELTAVAGVDGEVATPKGFGKGGIAAVGAQTCQTGTVGDLGADGARGAAAIGHGFLSYDGWSGGAGERGANGGPGQGGGGGGGGIGKAACYGASGGGGGAGGAGGFAGEGGGAGGSSFAIVAIRADLRFTEVILRSAQAGDGGSGGAGGGGATGGLGGLAAAAANGVKAGCHGGNGGNGGSGGSGGAGAGGSSAGIAYAGASPVLDGVTIEVGTPGKGGAAPEPAVDGLSSSSVEIPEAS